MATTLEDCDTIVEAAQRAGRTVMVNYIHR
jgi:predicted dehydrogenase